MTATKTLYASTLALAGLAGFSSGWALRPVEVRPVVSFVERNLWEYEEGWKITPGERESLRAILRDYETELKGLGAEFDRKYGDQVNAAKDKYDARIQAILTPARRR